MVSNVIYQIRPLTVRTLIRLLVATSAIYGFIYLNHIYSYMGFPRGPLKALEMTILAHVGLWLATFDAKGRWRFLVAFMLIPSAVGVYLFMWHLNWATLFIGLIGMGWLTKKVFRGW